MNRVADLDQNFCALESHTLLYPDMAEVVRNKGKSPPEPFNLDNYQKHFRKPYSKIVFYLTQTLDFLMYTVDNTIERLKSPIVLDVNSDEEKKEDKEELHECSTYQLHLLTMMIQ